METVRNVFFLIASTNTLYLQLSNQRVAETFNNYSWDTMADDSSKNIHTVNTDLETGTSSSLQQETHSTLPEEETRINTALNNYVSGTEAEKRLVRKVDFILLPMLWLMYVLAYIDRGNVVCMILRLAW